MGLPACCGVLGTSLPLAKTGVSGKEQEVCMPEPGHPTPRTVVPSVLPPGATHPVAEPPVPQSIVASVEGDCRFVVIARRLDGPGKSVGRVRRSTGT